MEHLAYLDADGCPAILLAFGYSLETDATTSVLAVRAGRVVVQCMTPAQFEADYRPSNVPVPIAIRALESLARTIGADLEAHRFIELYLNGPTWKLRLIDCHIGLRRAFEGTWVRRLFLARAGAA